LTVTDATANELTVTEATANELTVTAATANELTATEATATEANLIETTGTVTEEVIAIAVVIPIHAIATREAGHQHLRLCSSSHLLHLPCVEGTTGTGIVLGMLGPGIRSRFLAPTLLILCLGTRSLPDSLLRPPTTTEVVVVTGTGTSV
jgi:hypothetical protein